MKYIKIRKDELWTAADSATLDTSTMQWKPAKPELLPPSIKEWFVHNVMRKHFTYGQPYCVMCGYTETIVNLKP